MYSKGVQDIRKVLGPKFNLKRNRCFSVVFENRIEPFNDPFCFPFPVNDFLFNLWKRRFLRTHFKKRSYGAG
jgi:hypothetical protein